MSRISPSVARLASWHLWTAAIGLAVLLGVALALVGWRDRPAKAAQAPETAATWAAGQRLAPDFRLADASGASFSLRQLRGRPVLLTFIDPVCRNLCPLEARTLMKAVRALPAAQRPKIVAVSVNPWADQRANFATDAKHWHLGPDWRWAIGSEAALRKVWASYYIAWAVTTKTLVGVTVHEISHTEGAYLIDATGHERALLLAPYTASDVIGSVRAID